MPRLMHGSLANRVGHWLGRKWRVYVSLETGTLQWFQRKGVSSWLVNPFMWALKMLMVGILLYSAFWIGVIILIVFFIGWRICNASFKSDEEWAIGEQTDHKKSVFYDPINYNDTDDPRFDD